MQKVLDVVTEPLKKENVIKSVKTTPTKVNNVKYVFLTIAIMLIIYLFVELSLFADPEIIKSFISKFGLWAPLVLILLQMFQSIISIIPSQITTVASGYLFGPVLGLVYSLIGTFLGSSIIFFISRKYGKRLAVKFFHNLDITHFQIFLRQKKSIALFLARIAPIFPNDLISFAAGLTKISYLKFVLLSTIGFLVQMILLTSFGSGLAEGEVNITLIVISVFVGILFMIVLFKQKIRRWVIKDLHKIEKGLKKGVKIVF
jgi:uncharacterized membrane protein YdjX (TVP38/TMEM64 family)